MNLYKVILRYHYNYESEFTFLVVAGSVEKAEATATKYFKSYDYGDCHLHSIELIASEGQYAKPNILLINKE